jgi:MoaA/NifB/PqqE/SkfB family radical SAM enzyme
MFLKIKNKIYWLFINLKYTFRIKKFLLILRLIKNFFLIIFFKKNLLRYVDFAIGFRCNLNCSHCFATALIEKRELIVTPQQYSRIAKEAMRLGAVNFSFQGGEPLLYPELKDYIKAVNPKANLISVTTNGTLLTEEMVGKLKEWGVDILTVSLDSGIPREHDEFRGKEGCFFDIYEGIKKALSSGINVTIGTVVTSQNLHSEGIKRLIDISDSLKVTLMFILAIPIGRWKGREEVLLDKNDLEYLDNLVTTYPYVRTDFYANYFRRGCGAVKEILYLDPYGNVFACPFIHHSLGNVLKEPLSLIRERALNNKLFKYYHNVCIATLKEVYNG